MFEALKQFLEDKKDTGHVGENAAARYLKRTRNFKILERNWREGRDELDLIALDEGILVFVEVKTRRAGGLVPGYFSINKRKKRAIKRAARAYMRTLKERPKTYRLDVVEVNYHPTKEWEILYFSNIEWS